ncbi:hypothetical protein KNE206_53260 [Kitasatospora sp. NE20-6]|uniref:hypothetical protein n=1 Tax=Kitasatospora sp. NE20-6 TaxID=2859066 RepID=UPI0034DB9A11
MSAPADRPNLPDATLTTSLTVPTLRALHLLASSGTARVLLGARHFELPAASRPAGPAATAAMDTADVRAHLIRLQQARLLAHTGCYDIDRQASTPAARDLWPAWTSAVLAAAALGSIDPQGHIADAVEAALALADHPTTLAVLQHIRHEPRSEDALAAVLTDDGAARLPGQLDRLDHRKALLRLPDGRIGATIAGQRLVTMYDALGTWHRQHFPNAPSASATGMARMRNSSATTPTLPGSVASRPPRR